VEIFMIRASLYIILCSARNRIRLRLRRLKEPRYLFGTIAAAAYLYFTIFARLFGRGTRIQGRRRASPPAPVSFEMLSAAGPTIVGLVLLIMMVAGWLFPADAGLLDFSAAETQILFPAPVSRRALIVHRLMRSQLGLLFAAIVPALFFSSASGLSRARFALSMWVIFATMRVHFTGISLARASLALPGADVRRRQWGALAVVLAALAIVGHAVWRSFAGQPLTGAGDAAERIGEVGATGAAHWILWPFMALARPLFAPWPGPYLLALTAAAAVLALNVVWVLSSDASFQEAAAQAEDRRAEVKLHSRPVVRARTPGWRLAPKGRPETVFAWKSAMQLLRSTTGAAVARYIIPLAGVTIAATSGLAAATRATGVATIGGLVALAVAAFTIVLGPQLVRSDLREDLLHLDRIRARSLGSRIHESTVRDARVDCRDAGDPRAGDDCGPIHRPQCRGDLLSGLGAARFAAAARTRRDGAALDSFLRDRLRARRDAPSRRRARRPRLAGFQPVRRISRPCSGRGGVDGNRAR
jgi:ABC-2 type transport system permease protein